MAPHLPRVTTFPILPEGHLIYKMSAALTMPSKEKYGSPLIGQVAPEVVLIDQLGRKCSLHATISLGRPIVLFFFPLAGSPHCTLESCHFRDALAESAVFGDLDAIVIGVSQDSPEILRKFADVHDLGFIVLSDHNREAMQKFGVTRAWLGLINNRATFIIDPNGIVRGMCEGILDGRGHKTFAEKWLIRIEHELAGRTRTISNAVGPTPTNGRLPMATDGAALHRVVIGKDNSAAGAGIDRAPRYGAAPSFPPGSKSSASLVSSPKDKKHHGLRDLFAKKAAAEPQVIPTKDAADPLQPMSPGSNDSLSRASSSKSGGRRSLRNVFTRKAAPPLPPTYQHFDDNVQDFGQVEEVPSAQYDGVSYVTRYAGGGAQNGPHWDGKSATSSGSGSRRGGAHSRSPSNASHGNRAAHTNGRNGRATDAIPVVPIRRGGGSGRESPLSTGTAMFPTSPNLGSYSHLHGTRPSDVGGNGTAEDRSRATSRRAPAPSSANAELVGLGIPEQVQQTAANARSSSVPANRQPRRSRDVPEDVPRDAIEDEDESEDFVTQLADGVIDLTPRPRYEQYQQGLPVRPNTANGQEAQGFSAKPFGTPNTKTAGPRTRSRSRPSAETVRSPKASAASHLRHVASDDNLDGEASGRLTPLAPRSRPSTRPQLAPSRTSRDSETPTGPNRDSLESLTGAQVQAAKRMVIHKDPVSPRQLSRSGSLSATRTMPSPSVGQSPRIRATSTESDRGSTMLSPRKGRPVPARPAPAPAPTYAPPPPPVGAHSPPEAGHGGGGGGGGTSMSSPRTDLSSSSFPSSSGGSSDYASRSGSNASLGKPRESRRPSGVSVSSVSSSGTFGNRAGKSTAEV